MMDFFQAVRGLLKFDTIRIDNNICRLHYKATVIILIVFSLMVTSRQYFGDPIDCIVDGLPNNVMDSYCWMYSTFTVQKELSGRVGKDVVAPGVATHVKGEDEVKYHKYYQWVCFVLFFQAILFHVPRYIWKIWEGGRLKMLVSDLDAVIISKEIKSECKIFLVEYFTTHLRTHDFYAYRFIFCEILNFINVVGQIFLMDYFLDGEFSSYGSDVIGLTESDPNKRYDPMAVVFPKVTKCTFYNYGIAGSVQTFDGLCILPGNIVNEKIYVFLWFWFIILSILTGISLIYRAVVLFSVPFREVLLNARLRLNARHQVKVIARNYPIGDWFVLYQLGANIDYRTFKELVTELSESITEDSIL